MFTVEWEESTEEGEGQNIMAVKARNGWVTGRRSEGGGFEECLLNAIYTKTT